MVVSIATTLVVLINLNTHNVTSLFIDAEANPEVTAMVAESMPLVILLPCTFPVPSLHLPCTFPVPSLHRALAPAPSTLLLSQYLSQRPSVPS